MSAIPPATLVEPNECYGKSLLSMVEDYRLAGESRYCDVPELARGDTDAYLQLLRNRARDDAGNVPTKTFWLLSGEGMIGASRLRTRLTPDLEEWGGHISYDIRPSQRRKGYGSLLLGLTLYQARMNGLKNVLLMCWADNLASIKVMDNNGAILIGKGIRDGREFVRYQIT